MERKEDVIVRQAKLPFVKPLVRQAKLASKQPRLATVEFEDNKGAIISCAQYEQLPEEFRTQVRVIGRDANGIAIEADADIIDEILAWTMESEITLPGIDLGKMNPGKVAGMFRALEEARFYEDRQDVLEGDELA